MQVDRHDTHLTTPACVTFFPRPEHTKRVIDAQVTARVQHTLKTMKSTASKQAEITKPQKHAQQNRVEAHHVHEIKMEKRHVVTGLVGCMQNVVVHQRVLPLERPNDAAHE
jgi:hypothetical protein